jgi:DNA-binding MarR family transcriptional regulator
MSAKFEEDVLRALRRITRSIDLHSRQLATTFGLTVPQLVCLRVVGVRGPMSPSQLANEVSLSQATITGIVDRLVARQLAARERSSVDRRVVTVSITDAGRALVEAAPSPLQERFVAQLEQLSPEEREIIRLTLNKIVRMMGGDALDAAPLLTNESVISPPLDPEFTLPELSERDSKPPPRP